MSVDCCAMRTRDCACVFDALQLNSSQPEDCVWTSINGEPESVVISVTVK